VPWEMKTIRKIVARPVAGAPTQLHTDSYRGNLTKVQLGIRAALELDEDDPRRRLMVNPVTSDLQTPLHYAVRKHREDVVNVLLGAGADILMVDQDGNTVLHMCCEGKGHVGLLERFLSICELHSEEKNGAYTKLGTQRNKDDMMPLHVACISDRAGTGEAKDELIRRLVAMFPQDVNVKCGANTICHLLAKKPGSATVMEWLITHHDLDVNPGQPFLRYKTKDERARHLNVHLGLDAGDRGNSPLHVACFHGRHEAAQLLLRHGANTDVCNLDGMVPNIPRDPTRPPRHMAPKDLVKGGHWTTRGRQWQETKIEVLERDAKGRIKAKMSDEEHAAKEKLMKEKLKKLKERKMPKGQVEFPKESIDEVIKYMDPNGDGDIELKEMDLAVRMFNRKRAVAKLEKEARVVMRKLRARIEARKMTLQEAFTVIDKSGDGVISGQELIDGLHVVTMPQANSGSFDERLAQDLGISMDEAQDIVDKARAGDMECVEILANFRTKINDESKERGLSKKEILMVRDYMDQEKDNRIALEELEAAFARSDQSEEEEKREEVVAFVLTNLETYMKKKNMKLIQLFEEMDADNSGSLSVEELREALERMCAPSVQKNRAQELREKKSALERVQKERKEAEKKAREDATKALKERLTKVKAAKSATQKLYGPASRPGTSTGLDFAQTQGGPSDTPIRAATATPSGRLKPLRKLPTKPIVLCAICGGDKHSTGCQMYHQMVELTISLDSPWMPSPKAIGPFHRKDKWMDAVKPRRENKSPLLR